LSGGEIGEGLEVARLADEPVERRAEFGEVLLCGFAAQRGVSW